MISYLQGQLLKKTPGELTIDVQGVGYQVFISLTTYYQIAGQGEPISLFIHTHLREDSLKLFGFFDEEEKSMFEALVSISKVGPKLAMGILSGMPTGDLIATVSRQDISRLSTIPGVGRKTAERLALELKDKLEKMEISPSNSLQSFEPKGVFQDALSALMNLGYKKPIAEKVLKKVVGDRKDPVSLEDIIKESLNSL